MINKLSPISVEGVPIITALTLTSLSMKPLEVVDLYLNEPDSGGEHSDDQYKIIVKIHKSDHENIGLLNRAVDLVCQTQWPRGVPKNYVSPFVDGDTLVDKNPALTSYYIVTFKHPEPPKLHPKNSSITVGDLVRLHGCAELDLKDSSATIVLKLVQVDKCYAIDDRDNDAVKMMGADQQELLEAYVKAPENIRVAIRAMLKLSAKDKT
jgi:hypothetical protein